MSSLSALFVFGDEDTDTAQLSTVWERFDDLSAGGEWSEHLHDPSLEGYVVQEDPNDLLLRVGKDMIVGRLYADGANERTLGAPDLPHIEFHVEESLFERAEDETDRVAHADAFVDVLRETYFVLDPRPSVVYAMPESMQTAIWDSIGETPADADSLRRSRFNYLVWATVFTPQLVETYGRERLLSAPAWRTYEWDDGTVVLLSSADPLVQSNIDAMHDHLDIDPPW
ncbi:MULTISPECIES: hypothetical protein [Halorussus]|uniref:hypothetical protein n=1 Tax=Halorussus TaxID=1070314 RepID=UPI0020A0DF19|nr:hypothetical protein [Halorussus vallis]USZ74936.1 hypothetical protein NGM07_16035 [Halorussus vallis]